VEIQVPRDFCSWCSRTHNWPKLTGACRKAKGNSMTNILDPDVVIEILKDAKHGDTVTPEEVNKAYKAIETSLDDKRGRAAFRYGISLGFTVMALIYTWICIGTNDDKSLPFWKIVNPFSHPGLCLSFAGVVAGIFFLTKLVQLTSD
jgi:hypothetical protein